MKSYEEIEYVDQKITRSKKQDAALTGYKQSNVGWLQ